MGRYVPDKYEQRREMGRDMENFVPHLTPPHYNINRDTDVQYRHW